MSNYNKCEGCKLWNGHHCTGARSYEPNADEHKAICNEHMAEQFWVVSKQLYNAEARVKELERKVELMMDCPDCKVDEYKKALEEIEEYCNNVLSFTAVRTTESDILNIINKAKGEE